MLWILVSGAFALYVATFASYNKTYGALASVVVFLVWLWLTNVVILLGAELDADSNGAADRRRQPAPRSPSASSGTRPNADALPRRHVIGRPRIEVVAPVVIDVGEGGDDLDVALAGVERELGDAVAAAGLQAGARSAKASMILHARR